MKCLKRNKRSFYYALYTGKERFNHTYRPLYGDAIRLTGNISPANGVTSVEQFGNNVDYDKVIVLDDPHCPITENSVLFIDVDPERNSDGDYLYDYIVRKVARSLNSVSIAISKVVVS